MLLKSGELHKFTVQHFNLEKPPAINSENIMQIDIFKVSNYPLDKENNRSLIVRHSIV